MTERSTPDHRSAFMRLRSRLRNPFSRFGQQRSGSVVIVVALMIVPIILSIGIAVDYIRAYNVKWKMRADLDAALISGVRNISNLTEDELKARVVSWFNTNSHLTTFRLSPDDVTVTKSSNQIEATAAVNVATTFMSIAGIPSVRVAATSTVVGGATSYLNVYLVLDKSASMMLAATTDGQTKLNTNAGCVFACHTESLTRNGRSYTYYEYAKSLGVKLRSDVLQDAALAVLDDINAVDPTHTRIKVGLYRLSTTVTQVLAPTTDTALARTKITSTGTTLGPDSSTDGTYFDASMTSLASFVGTNGTGASASSPLKLVMLVTDGVNSKRSYVTDSPGGQCSCTSYTYEGKTYYNPNTRMPAVAANVAPLNPAWCKRVTNNGATMQVLYTTYLPLPWDWGWVGTLGRTMQTSAWHGTWNATETTSGGLSSSSLRIAYLPQALKDCASSSDNFLSATSVSDITTGLSNLFKQYLAAVRITR